MSKYDPEAMRTIDLDEKTESSALPPVDNSARTVLVTIATIFTIVTYLEDVIRLFTMWEGQVQHVSNVAGLPSALSAIILLVIGWTQLCSVLMLIPPSAHPQAAKVIMTVSVALAATVLLQPLLFDQMSNRTLLILSLAQLGALALIFCNAHIVRYSKRGPFATYLNDASSAAPVSARWAAWIQLMARLLLTLDLFVGYTLRIVGALDGESKPLTTTTHVLIILSGLCIWLGLKTTYCACALSLAAFADAFSRYPYFLETDQHRRDFQQFHFYQCMTPVGGMLLLAAFGPGKISLDDKSKRL